MTLAILDTMLQESQSHGLRLVLMIIPEPQLRSDPSKVEVLLSNWAGKTGTPLIKLRETYLRLAEADRARLYTGHWTVYGAGVVAEVLAEKIREVLPTSQ